LKVGSGIKDFFEEFYKISDTGTEEAHERYADSWVEGGTIVMASKVGRGRDGEFLLFSATFFLFLCLSCRQFIWNDPSVWSSGL